MASDSASLALWGYLLFGGSLISELSLLAMTDFGSGPDYDRYGLGVFEQTHLAQGFGAQAVGNGGWEVGGYSSVLVVLPSEGLAISVMTNTAGSPIELVMPVAQELRLRRHRRLTSTAARSIEPIRTKRQPSESAVAQWVTSYPLCLSVNRRP